MLRIIWETMKERKWPVIIYCAASVLLLILYIALFPSLQTQSQQLTEVLKSMPDNLLKAFGSSADQLSNFTLESLLASKQFSMMFQLLAAILAISIAANDLSGEIEIGTIDFLLSQPVSRLKFYFARFLSGTFLLTIFVVLSTIVVMPIAGLFHVVYNPEIYWKLFVVAWLYTIAFYAFSYLLSVIFSAKGRVFAITAGMLTAMYAVYLISVLKENLDKLKYLSFFHYFSADIMYSGQIDKTGALIFIITIIGGLLIGAVIFDRRDILV